MEKIVVFGIGNIAEVAYSYITNDSEYEIVAFTVDKEYLTKSELFNLPVVPFDELEDLFPPKGYKIFIAIGYQNLNKLRQKKYEEVKNKGYQLISYISSKISNFGNAEIGDNCFILEDNVLQPFIKIGNNVTLWSGNHIGHHSTIEDHCFISSHVVISGLSTIKQNCFIGVNSTIGHEITIEKDNFIGAGCLITKSTEAKNVFISKNTEKFRIDSERFMKFSRMK